MKKLLHFACIVLLFGSCTGGNSDKPGFRTVTVDFANAKLSLPHSYQRFSVEELENRINRDGKTRSLTQVITERLDFVKKNPDQFAIYCDTTNLANSVWFQKGELVTFTDENAKQYLELLGMQLESHWKPHRIKFDLMESKFLQGNGPHILKIKYKIFQHSVERYTTQYLVSSKTQTLGVIVNNTNGSDYEEHVRELRME